MLLKHSIQLLTAATCCFAFGASKKPATIGFMPEALPEGRIGDLYRRFIPDLRLVYGDCSPVAAVDAQGKTSGGLTDVDKDSKSCRQPIGQIYARGIEKDDPENKWGMPAIMYAWYFPMIYEDETRKKTHDWQQIVVWLSVRNKGENAQDYDINQVSYSRPDGYMKTSSPTLRQNSTSPIAVYQFLWWTGLLTPHKRGLAPWSDKLASDVVKDIWGTWTPPQLMIAWEKFTPEAKKAVSDHANFGGNIAPFSDHPGTFLSHLNASFYPTASRDLP